MIVDDLDHAQNVGYEKGIEHWQRVLQHFDEHHPLHQT
jgi:hypothetical protein